MPITTQEGFLKVLTAAGGTMPKFHVLRQECDDDTISSQVRKATCISKAGKKNSAFQLDPRIESLRDEVQPF